MSSPDVIAAVMGFKSKSAPVALVSPRPSISPPQCGACLFKAHCLPADLEGDLLADFERSVTRQRYPLKSGHVLVRQGDSMDALYALRVGSLKVFIDEPDGTERILGFRFPGTVIGLAEPERGEWTRTFVALENTWLCRIPIHAIGDPARRQLIRLMSDQLRREYNSHLTLAFNSGAKKVVSFLIDMSSSFEARGLSANRFHLPMNYIDIANYLGMRHESVSRALSKLQELGLLNKRGRYIDIPDLQALRGFKND